MVAVPEDDTGDLMGQHSDTQDDVERLLDLMHEQSKTMAVQAEALESIDKRVETANETAQAWKRITYALIALLAGVLFKVGLFEPVDILSVVGL